MVVTTPSASMPPPTCDNYKAKKCILGHINHDNNYYYYYYTTTTKTKVTRDWQSGQGFAKYSQQQQSETQTL